MTLHRFHTRSCFLQLRRIRQFVLCLALVSHHILGNHGEPQTSGDCNRPSGVKIRQNSPPHTCSVELATPRRRFHTFHTRDLTHAGVNKNGFWHLRRVGQIIVFENQSQRVGQRPRLPSPYLQHNKAPNCTGIQFVHGFCQPVNKPGESIESAVALHWQGYMVEYKNTWRGRNRFNRVSNNNYKEIVMAIMYQADNKLYIEKSLKLSVVCKNDLIVSVSRRRRRPVSRITMKHDWAFVTLCFNIGFRNQMKFCSCTKIWSTSFITLIILLGKPIGGMQAFIFSFFLFLQPNIDYCIFYCMLLQLLSLIFNAWSSETTLWCCRTPS